MASSSCRDVKLKLCDTLRDCSPLLSAPVGVFQQMLHARRQPKLIIKVKSANNRTKTQLRYEEKQEKQNTELEHQWIVCANSSSRISDECVFAFSFLPDTLLHCASCIHLLALHRQLLADALLMDRPTMQDAGKSHLHWLLSKEESFSIHREIISFSLSDLMCSPVLSTFPVLLDQPDLLDAVRVSKDVKPTSRCHVNVLNTRQLFNFCG